MEIGSEKMLQIAGGYGLFLKQQWLSENRDKLIVIPLENWIDPTPRATSDFDLLLGLEFISDTTTNTTIPQILEAHGFVVTEKPGGQRWQFVKKTSSELMILAELHAPTPGPDREDLRADEVRVKPKPSLRGRGVHARHNEEAIGAVMFPFLFNLEAVPLAVPNPVTWVVMKLTAMSDFWIKAHDSNSAAESRAFARKQAEKHAQDVCRVVAMMSMEERDRVPVILEAVRESAPFLNAAEIFAGAFQIDGWALELVSRYWEVNDLATILGILETWMLTESTLQEQTPRD